MRQGSGGRRARGRSGGRKHVPPKMQNFDSNGPDVRVRGNANQVYEKYLALARDANSAGDRVIAESYFQHAEHYYRIMTETMDPPADGRGREGRPAGQGGDGRERAERWSSGDGDGRSGGEEGSRTGDAPRPQAAGEDGGDRRRARDAGGNGRGEGDEARNEAADDDAGGPGGEAETGAGDPASA